VVQHGSVFTHSPSLWNPYTIQLAMYSLSILMGAKKTGNRTCGLFIPRLESRGFQALSL
jgi:hypothetical protein